jgi:hypothetical protein
MNLVFGMDGVISTPCRVYEEWCKENEILYDRLIFDRPYNAIYVTETPANAKYYKHERDLAIVADMFEEWKNDYRNEWASSKSKME